jgi:hypothetical protein
MQVRVLPLAPSLTLGRMDTTIVYYRGTASDVRVGTQKIPTANVYVVVSTGDTYPPPHTPEKTQEELANAALIEKAFKELCDDERPTFVPHVPSPSRIYVDPHSGVSTKRGGPDRYPVGFE